MANEFALPPGLPRPEDDGACAHLAGLRMPHVRLPSTAGGTVDCGTLESPRTVLYFYPMTGVPGAALPDGWDAIPGARGCTPEACAFRDHFDELRALGAAVFAVSTQGTDYQKEMAARLHLPFPVLSDSAFALCGALKLPTFTAAGLRLVKRLTLIIRDGKIEKVFYPVFPPDAHAGEILQWLRDHPFEGHTP